MYKVKLWEVFPDFVVVFGRLPLGENNRRLSHFVGVLTCMLYA